MAISLGRSFLFPSGCKRFFALARDLETPGLDPSSGPKKTRSKRRCPCLRVFAAQLRGLASNQAEGSAIPAWTDNGFRVTSLAFGSTTAAHGASDWVYLQPHQLLRIAWISLRRQPGPSASVVVPPQAS
jgi:hypothetical protein